MIIETMGNKRAKWSRHWSDRRGSISLIMAESALPLMIAVGAGVDMTRLTLAKTALQSVVGGAALADATAYKDAN